MESGEID